MDVPRDVAESGGGGSQTRNPVPTGNPNPNGLNPNTNTNPNSPHPSIGGSKGKSCKGCAYYSSVHMAKSKNPTCVGFSRTLPEVPPYVVGETELEASKEGRTLTNFKYACIGYSVYLDNKDSSADPKDKTSKLPFCVGLEGPNNEFVRPLKILKKGECGGRGRELVQVVLEEKSSTSPIGHVPAHAHKTEEHEHATPQPRRYKPPSTTAEEFLNRFQRNASLVASGVVRNLNRVGNYVKETLDDILYRRPK